MILKTPVLKLDACGCWYNGLSSPYATYACAARLENLFEVLPQKIILQGSTSPDSKAVKVHLDSPDYDYGVDVAEEGSHTGFLVHPLLKLMRQFVKDGHTTIYLSMIDCTSWPGVRFPEEA